MFLTIQYNTNNQINSYQFKLVNLSVGVLALITAVRKPFNLFTLEQSLTVTNKKSRRKAK